MANIDKKIKRRLRIEGKTNNISGHYVTVHDADTGEPIENITALTIHVGVGKLNKAEVIYYPSDHHLPIEKKITTDNPEFSLTALEYLQEEK
jgi:hypothetical protein